jgi:putative endonuclease
MARHNELGKRGEALAAAFLAGRGYAILHQNWRYRHYEIDLVAIKNKQLHFVEVKTRRTYRYGFPEASLNKKKLRHLMDAAALYLRVSGHEQPAQYDVVSILLQGSEAPEFHFIEDVFV